MQSEILFALVAKGKQVLIKSGDTRFEGLVEQLLAEPKGAQQKAYVHDDYSYNYISKEDGYVYVAVCNERFPTRVAFAFLQHIEQHFEPGNDKLLVDQMKRFSDPAKVDKIESIKAELGSVKEVMKENIDKILEREQILKSLEAKTEELDFDSRQFAASATGLHNTLWWRNKKIQMGIAVVIFLVLLIIIWASCGSTFKNCRSTPSPEPQPQGPSRAPSRAPGSRAPSRAPGSRPPSRSPTRPTQPPGSQAPRPPGP